MYVNFAETIVKVHTNTFSIKNNVSIKKLIYDALQIIIY